MRYWVVAFAMCTLFAAAAAAEMETSEQAAANAAAAEAMYLEQNVVGTILAADRMYSDAEGTWWELSIRAESVEPEDAKSSPGDLIGARYIPTKGAARMTTGPGDQVRAGLRLEEAKAEAGWWVVGDPEVLGRGEFLNPGKEATEDLGSPDAKLLVKMLAPMGPECHQITAALLRELAERDPDRVRVQIFDMARPAGRMEMNRERLKCAAVLVNNRFEFVLGEEGDESKVELWHKPNTAKSTYNSEDVIAVVERELARTYPAEETEG
jgi:hypothetical protein